MNVRLVIGHQVIACTSLQDVLNTKAHHFMMVEASLRMVPMQYNLPQGKKTCGRLRRRVKKNMREVLGQTGKRGLHL
jgi:hypothetical protein